LHAENVFDASGDVHMLGFAFAVSGSSRVMMNITVGKVIWLECDDVGTLVLYKLH
jgi:hypothetical protein